jgi:hypothetical protein
VNEQGSAAPLWSTEAELVSQAAKTGAQEPRCTFQPAGRHLNAARRAAARRRRHQGQSRGPETGRKMRRRVRF